MLPNWPTCPFQRKDNAGILPAVPAEGSDLMFIYVGSHVQVDMR